MQEHVRESTDVVGGSIADPLDPTVVSLGPRVESRDSETSSPDGQRTQCHVLVGSSDARTRTKAVQGGARRVQDRSCRPIMHAVHPQVAFCDAARASVDPLTSSCLLAKTSVDPLTGSRRTVKASFGAIASSCRVTRGVVDAIASLGDAKNAFEHPIARSCDVRG